MWWERKGTLNLPLVVFSAPTKSPRQKVLIAKRCHPGGNGITTPACYRDDSGSCRTRSALRRSSGHAPAKAIEKPGGNRRHKPHATDQSRIVSHSRLRFCTFTLTSAIHSPRGAAAMLKRSWSCRRHPRRQWFERNNPLPQYRRNSRRMLRLRCRQRHPQPGIRRTRSSMLATTSLAASPRVLPRSSKRRRTNGGTQRITRLRVAGLQGKIRKLSRHNEVG